MLHCAHTPVSFLGCTLQSDITGSKGLHNLNSNIYCQITLKENDHNFKICALY